MCVCGVMHIANIFGKLYTRCLGVVVWMQNYSELSLGVCNLQKQHNRRSSVKLLARFKIFSLNFEISFFTAKSSSS